MYNQKFGLVIQGPLYSKFKKIKNHHYDCNENIDYILNNFSRLFSEIILVTWESEKTKLNKNYKKIKNLKILFLKDPGIPNLYSNDVSDNRLRQFYSSYKGICALSQNIDIAIKIRSDFRINLKPTINFFLKEEIRKKKLLKKKFEGVICSYRFILTRPYWLSDFLYIGRKNMIKNFFLSQIKFKKERFAIYNKGAPEGDSVLKFLYYKKKKINIFKESYYYPSLPKKIEGSNFAFFKKEFDLWQFALKNYFSVLPDNIKKTSVWKGISYKNYEYLKNENFCYKDFLRAESNYVNELRKIIFKKKNFLVINKNFQLINFNYIKRKYENNMKKKNYINNFFNILNNIYNYYRRVLFLLLN